ncbi:hypothetical protein LXL04_029959 [Taraxacum kok-saghyz]
MADGFWSRQREQPQQQQQQQHEQQQQLYSSASMLKRPRSDYDLQPSGLPFSYEMPNYMPQNDDNHHAIKDTKTIGSAYDRYLQTTKLSSGEGSGYGVGVSGSGVGREMQMHSLPVLDPVLMNRGGPPMGLHHHSTANGRAHHSPVNMKNNNMNMIVRSGGRETLPLPPNASSTLYIEGLPPNCTKREVAHIFRPFVGYREVRIISKESKHRKGDPVLISFVDFNTPACAATAMSALQGYKMDEHDPDSAYLRLQFSKNPGPRAGPTRRGGRR